MSTIDRTEVMAEPWDDLDEAPNRQAPPAATSIVPKSSIAGRSLTFVIAIMTFLAALTTGAVMMVVGAASDWQSEVGREVTIQVRPVSGRDIEADVRKAIEITRATAGIADVRAYTKEESERLVAPWLGGGLALDDLPIPRMIVVKLVPGATPDFATLRGLLTAQVGGASLDDHRRWIATMRTMTETAVLGGIALLALVVAVTVLSVTFATRGTMAANRPIIEVLHYVGATDGYVGYQFQRHFLVLGFRGGALGGGAAIALFGFLEAANTWLSGTPGGVEAAALFGSFSVGVTGYLAIIIQVVVMAVVTALTSRRTVNRTLENIE